MKQRKLNEQINRACRDVYGCPGAVMYVTEVNGHITTTKKEPINYVYKANYENELIVELKKEVKSTKKADKLAYDVPNITNATVD